MAAMAEEGSDVAHSAGQTMLLRHTIRALMDGFDAVARVLACLVYGVGISFAGPLFDKCFRFDSSGDGFGDEFQRHGA